MPHHVIIIGDELESCLCALACTMYGLQVTILRRSTQGLGGLSTRGGLSYMDLTPEFIPPLMANVLKQAGLLRVGLHPERTQALLSTLLKEAGVVIKSGLTIRPIFSLDRDNRRTLVGLEDDVTHQRHNADFFIDGTPDATILRRMGVPALLGLGGVFGHNTHKNALGVSPVFRVAGLECQTLRDAEHMLRHDPMLQKKLPLIMPWLDKKTRADLIDRPTFAPDDSDYLDILNPIIGAAYHLWRHGKSDDYATSPSWVDGFNISRLSDGTLGFNGLIMRMPLLMQLDASEQEHPPTAEMHDEMNHFLAFLKQISGIETLTLIPPEQIYVRQTVQTQATHIVTARNLFNGGCPPNESIGTFSYWLDFRGVHPWETYPEFNPMPKPVYTIGLAPHFPDAKNVGLENVAMLSRAAGFSPLAQGTCRIVQYQCIVAEALAAALSVSLKRDCHPLAIPASEIHATQETLVHRLNAPLPNPRQGVSTMTPALESSWLLAADDAIAQALASTTPCTLLQGSVFQGPYA